MTSSLVGSEMCIRDRCWCRWAEKQGWRGGEMGSAVWVESVRACSQIGGCLLYTSDAADDM
eukprot:5115263-Prorocentrum_lima.AAC.1